MSTVMGVTGPIDADDLGRTLVHEHIVITYPGEELDRTRTWRRADTCMELPRGAACTTKERRSG